MCINYKSGFTLAETIITLAIIGVVIVAAIPAITSKLLSDNTRLKAYCTLPRHQNEARCNKLQSRNLFFECGDSRASICTAGEELAGGEPKGLLVVGGQDPLKYDDFPIGNDHYFSFTFNSTDRVRLFDNFLSDENLIKIGEYYFQEYETNLFITKDLNTSDEPLLPVSQKLTENVIIGNITNNSLSSFTENKMFQKNVILGYNNLLNNCQDANSQIYNNIIFGANNTMCRKTPSPAIISIVNSFVYGEENIIQSSRSLTIGYGNTTKNNYSVTIGNKLNDNTNEFAIGNFITIPRPTSAANRTITLSYSPTAPLIAQGNFIGKFAQTSDIRSKNINGRYSKGLKEILQVQPVRFYYNDDNTATEHTGVIAQDIIKLFPEAVVKMPNGYYGVDNDPIFFAMVNALKEINEKAITEQKRHEKLQKELNELEKELKATRKNNVFSGLYDWIENLLSIIGGWINA